MLRRFRIPFLAGLLSILLASCATLPEPSGPNSTLLIGELTLEAKNFDYQLDKDVTINGVTNDGMTLFLVQNETKAVTKLTPADKGFFSTAALPPGNYYISKITYLKTVQQSGASVISSYGISIDPAASTKFVLKPGSVTNLGKLLWRADGKGYYDIAVQENFPAVKTHFQTLFPSSKWSTLAWLDVKVTPHLDFDLDLSPSVAGAESRPRTAAADFSGARLDALVKQVPASIQAKQKTDADAFLKELTAFLIKDSPNGFETVKRLHDWVTDNISYDAPSFLSGKLPDQSYKTVLATRLAVCEGYAVLFKKMCELSGIPCALVDGYSRGYGSTVFSAEDPSAANHAWNIVEVQKTPYLIDTTWDSGYLENNRFVKSYGTGYLFADPYAFLHSHFPSNPQYQLMKTPISPAEFTKLPVWSAKYYSAGIAGPATLTKTTTGNDFAFAFTVPADTDLMASVIDVAQNKEVPGAAFRQRTGDTITVYAALPQQGKYLLRLFARSQNDPPGGLYAGCGELGLIADKTSATRFPRIFASFGPKDQLLAPLGKPVVAGQSTTFRVTLTNAPFCLLIAGQKKVLLHREGQTNTFSGDIVPDSDTIVVAKAQTPDGNGGWQSALEFPVSK